MLGIAQRKLSQNKIVSQNTTLENRKDKIFTVQSPEDEEVYIEAGWQAQE